MTNPKIPGQPQVDQPAESLFPSYPVSFGDCCSTFNMNEQLIAKHRKNSDSRGPNSRSTIELANTKVTYAPMNSSDVMDENSPLLSVQQKVRELERPQTRPQRDAESEYEHSPRLSTSPAGSSKSEGPTMRQPFTHNSMSNLHGKPEDINRSATYHRYRYISKLSGHSVHMMIPDHILPVDLFLVFPTGKPEAKQSSLVTIFAIWNTMMGTSLLSMPWALGQAGFGFGIGLMIVIAGICLYTCYLILKLSNHFAKKGEIVEFSDICKTYLGRYGELAATVFSIAAIGGAAIVFWVLMSNFLFNSGKFIHESITHAFPTNYSHNEVLCPVGPSAHSTSPNSIINADTTGFYKYWQQQNTIPFFLIALLFPLCSVKSPTFFTKFNSLGTLAVMYIIIFVIVKAKVWGIHMESSTAYLIPEIKLQFPALTGTLTLAFFIHNCVLSILSHQKNPENNARDISIAYFLVAFTYTLVGALFYASFPLEKSCIHQIFLDNLPSSDLMAFGARIGLFFQLVTVFPLVVYIVRVQFMLYFYRIPYPGPWRVFLLNFVLITLCVTIACLYPHVGNIIRYSGSISGLAYIFALPCVVHLMALKKKSQLSWPSTIFHLFLALLGVLNLISQFLISV